MEQIVEFDFTSGRVAGCLESFPWDEPLPDAAAFTAAAGIMIGVTRAAWSAGESGHE